MRRETIPVEGMACTGCEENVQKALRGVDGVRRIEADHEAGTVEVVVEGDAAEDTRAAIERAGYDVAP